MISLRLLERASELSEHVVERCSVEGGTGSGRDLFERSSGHAPLVADFQFSAGLKRRPRSWKSTLTSLAIHAMAVGLVLIVFAPAVRKLSEPHTRFVLLDPWLPHRTKLISKLHTHMPQVAKRLKLDNPVIAKVTPAPKREVVHPPQILPDLPIKIAADAPNIELPKPEPPPAPKFESREPAKVAKTEKPVALGAFGDPQAVPANPQAHTPQNLPRLGSFDAANGAQGESSGGHRAVQASGFGTVAGGTGTALRSGSHAGSVRTGGFGDGDVPGKAVVPGRVATRPSGVNIPAEILFKPKPVYSAEALALKIEGQVVLDVILEASGRVRVLQVLHALGHGLDEAAKQAAAQVRFRPAVKDGVPVDTRASLHITFQLT